MHLPRPVRPMHHGGLDIGGLAGAGYQGQARRQSLTDVIRIIFQVKIQFLQTAQNLFQANHGNVDGRHQGNGPVLAGPGFQHKGSGVGQAEIGRRNPDIRFEDPLPLLFPMQEKLCTGTGCPGSTHNGKHWLNRNPVMPRLATGIYLPGIIPL